MTTDIRTRAEKAATQRLITLQKTARFLPTPYGYLEEWRDNLVDGVTSVDFEPDLLKGSGNELTDQPGEPAKFRASFSSSALAVNTFGPFRHHPEHLEIGGLSGFTAAQFEYQCPNGLRGTNPHFDFWCLSSDTAVAVESKFLEPLSSKVANFSDQYIKPFADAEAPWAALFDVLRSDARTYAFLDAAQLLKHYLGLIHSHSKRQRVLAYVYWEPTNAAALPEYIGHRNEVRDFAKRVSGCATRFVALSHADLWSQLQDSSTLPGMPEHLARLRARYSIAI